MTPVIRQLRLLALALVSTASWRTAGAQTPAPAPSAAALRTDSILATYDKTDVMVPMRDGVKLHTTLYVPRGRTDPLPIIFARTPYGIANVGRVIGSSLSDVGGVG